MATVTGIEVNSSTVRIYLDHRPGPIIQKKHFSLRPVREGEDLEEEDYLNALAADQFRDACDAALTMLESCDQSCGRVRRKLAEKGYVAPAVQAVIEKLTEEGILDDRRLARRLIETEAAKGTGKKAIRQKLLTRQLKPELVDSLLAELEEGQQTEGCMAAAKKLLPRYAGDPPRVRRSKLSQALARRGYSWDTISTVLERTDDFE